MPKATANGIEIHYEETGNPADPAMLLIMGFGAQLTLWPDELVERLAGHGFRITDLLEPEWPEGHVRVWGGWSGVRGRIGPGTAVIGCDLD